MRGCGPRFDGAMVRWSEPITRAWVVGSWVAGWVDPSRAHPEVEDSPLHLRNLLRPVVPVPPQQLHEGPPVAVPQVRQARGGAAAEGLHVRLHSVHPPKPAVEIPGVSVHKRRFSRSKGQQAGSNEHPVYSSVCFKVLVFERFQRTSQRSRTRTARRQPRGSGLCRPRSGPADGT